MLAPVDRTYRLFCGFAPRLAKHRIRVVVHTPTQPPKITSVCSSGSDTTPLAQLHGLRLQQPNAQAPPDHTLEANNAANQASQQSWLHLQSLLASMPPPALAQGQVNSPRMHHLMAQGHHSAPGCHQPSQQSPSTHLRDGEAATPSEVVAALSEYMARANRPKPPTGCAADAVKLFVGNIPKHCTEAVLHKVFQCYGVIVEIAVVRFRGPHAQQHIF